MIASDIPLDQPRQSNEFRFRRLHTGISGESWACSKVVALVAQDHPLKQRDALH
jgi:hypothetical protein